MLFEEVWSAVGVPVHPKDVDYNCSASNWFDDQVFKYFGHLVLQVNQSSERREF